MNINLNWGDVDQTFIIMQFSNQWTNEDFHIVMQEFYTLLAQTDHAVELMVDMRQAFNTPKNLVTMVRAALSRSASIKGSVKQVVVITHSNFWERIFSVAKEVYGKELRAPVHFVTTVDDAYSMLNALSTRT